MNLDKLIIKYIVNIGFDKYSFKEEVDHQIQCFRADFNQSIDIVFINLNYQKEFIERHKNILREYEIKKYIINKIYEFLDIYILRNNHHFFWKEITFIR